MHCFYSYSYFGKDTVIQRKWFSRQSAFHLSIVKPKPNLSRWTVTKSKDSEPIKTRRKYWYVANTMHGKVCASESGLILDFTSDWVTSWRDFFEPLTERSSSKPKQTRNYFRYSSENWSQTRPTHIYSDIIFLLYLESFWILGTVHYLWGGWVR